MASTGAWVDGFAVTPDQAGRMLRSWLAKTDYVTVVVANGVASPHTVTFTDSLARDLVGLAGALTDEDHGRDVDSGGDRALSEAD